MGQDTSTSLMCASRQDSHSQSSPELGQAKPNDVLFAAIRDVFSTDPVFAEQVISSLQHLPPSPRDKLLRDPGVVLPSDAEDRPADGADGAAASGCGSGSSGQAGSPTQSLPKAKRNGPADRTPKKRMHDDDDQGGDDPESPPKRQHPNGGCKPNNEKWACPFWVAYPSIVNDPKFANCGPPKHGRVKFKDRSCLK